MNHFKSTKPQHSALHWDSKFLTDSVGQGWEAEAILVSGAPNWVEGKLLDVAELVDGEGGPSSTGQAQFQANKEVVKLWDLKRDIRAFVFDTTASNTGCRKGCFTLLEKLCRRSGPLCPPLEAGRPRLCVRHHRQQHRLQEGLLHPAGEVAGQAGAVVRLQAPHIGAGGQGELAHRL